MTPEQARELVTLAQHGMLAEAATRLARDGLLKTRAWLDARVCSDAALAVLDCLACRAHFAQKFEDAPRWLLTREAAEQATASALARWRADYLARRFPQAKSLAELGTGIGGDSVYLARRFRWTGYERDQARATLARANLAELSPQASGPALQSRAVEPAEPLGDVLFADPARRGRARTFEPEQWSPPLSALLGAQGFGGLVIKTAPGLDLALLPAGMEVHFLSLQGELKEAMLLRGGSAGEASRHAWLWVAGKLEPLHRWGEPLAPPVRLPRPGDWLHNPDPALLRSGLLGQWAAELEAGLVHAKIAYLCGPRQSPDPWAASFAVMESIPLRWKRLAEALRATDWSDLELLTRGVPFDQGEALHRLRGVRKVMRGRPGGRGTVIVYRSDDGYQALLARRAAQDPHEPSVLLGPGPL